VKECNNESRKYLIKPSKIYTEKHRKILSMPFRATCENIFFKIENI